MTPSPLLLTVTASEHGQRLDRFLLLHHVAPSRKKVKALIDGGLIRIGDRCVSIASWQVQHHDLIRIQPPSPQPSPASYHKSLDLLYEDDHLVIVNKPPGMFSTAKQKPSAPPPDLIQHLDRGPLWLCHRLDRQTSGCWVLAKDALTQKKMQHLFCKHKMHKEYVALVHPLPQVLSLHHLHPSGQPAPSSHWTQCQWIQRSSQGRWHITKPRTPQALLARTQFWLCAHNPHQHTALLRALPRTGRTHQIRLQLTTQHCSIIGDRLYGSSQWQDLHPTLSQKLTHQHLLHASHLSFPHPHPHPHTDSPSSSFHNNTIRVFAPTNPTFLHSAHLCNLHSALQKEQKRLQALIHHHKNPIRRQTRRHLP